MWNPQTVIGFRILFITELAYEQLKARAGFLVCSDENFKNKDLTLVNGVHEQTFRRCLIKSVDIIF